MQVTKLGLYRGYKPVIVPTDTGRITMQGIVKPVIAIDNNTGEYLKTMFPNEEYEFSTNLVKEIPVMKKGGIKEYKELLKCSTGGSVKDIRDNLIRELFKDSIYEEDEEEEPIIEQKDIEEEINPEIEKIKQDNLNLQAQLLEMQQNMFNQSRVSRRKERSFSNNTDYNSEINNKDGMFARVTTYGYSDDPNLDTNSKNAIGHSNNKLVEGSSVALSQQTAKKYGFKKGDFINVSFKDGSTQKVRYDDTIPPLYDNDVTPRIDFFTPSKKYQRIEGQNVRLSK